MSEVYLLPFFRFYLARNLADAWPWADDRRCNHRRDRLSVPVVRCVRHVRSSFDASLVHTPHTRSNTRPTAIAHEIEHETDCYRTSYVFPDASTDCHADCQLQRTSSHYNSTLGIPRRNQKKTITENAHHRVRKIDSSDRSGVQS